MANCQGSLQDSKIGFTHGNKTFGLKSRRLDAHDSRRLVSEGRAHMDAKYCAMLLAAGTFKMKVDVGDILADASFAFPGNSQEKAKLIKDAAIVFKSGVGAGAACDLTDLTGTYWVYPAVPLAHPVDKTLHDAIPLFHNPKCPSFYSRLSAIRGSMAVCMAGDSNSKRTCMYIRDVPNLAPGVRLGCPDFDHNKVMLAARHPTIGQHNLPGYTKKVRDCLTSNAQIVALGVGHHLSEFTAEELATHILEPIKKNLDSLHNAGPTHTVAERVVVAWASVASHVRDFATSPSTSFTHPPDLLMHSNSYREVLDNQVIKRAFSSPACKSPYGDVNPDFTSILATVNGNRTCQSRRLDKYVFVDAFHPSLALGSVSHGYGDPVHFNSEYFFMHGFIVQLMLVAQACHGADGCDKTAEIKENEHFQYLTWNPVREVRALKERKQKFPSGVDYGQHEKTYMA